MSIKSFSDGVDQLNNAVLNKLTTGISWAMLTFEKDSNEPWKLHLRDNQPCYGEMRKYKTSHGDLCTQPEDRRPLDLHHPFPLGTPMAVGVRWGVAGEHAKEMAKTIFNPILSPWKVGFKKPEILMKGDVLAGISFYDTAFDPTVFVHALKFFRQTALYNPHCYSSFRSYGLEPLEAMLAGNVITSYLPNNFFRPYYSAGMFTPRFSVRRWKDKNPLDLTGGTFRKRFDYNRKQLNFIFHDEADGIDLHRSIVKLTGADKIVPTNVFRDAVKEVLS